MRNWVLLNFLLKFNEVMQHSENGVRIFCPWPSSILLLVGIKLGYVGLQMGTSTWRQLGSCGIHPPACAREEGA